MSAENVELVRVGLELYNSGDLTTLMDACADDVEVVAGGNLLNAGTYRGKQELREFLAGWEEVWSEFSVEPEQIIDAGDSVVALVIQHGRGAGSGVELHEPYGFYFEIKDGRLTRWHLYDDRADALAMAGLPAS